MKTVLLVDDEQEVLQSLSGMLIHLGCRVIARSDAKAALSLLRDGAQVDLVITDYCMPEMDGMEFLVLVGRMRPSVPRIVVTGYGEVETYVKMLSIGVCEYVNKPVRLKELDRIVKTALTLSADNFTATHADAVSSSGRFGPLSPSHAEDAHCRFRVGNYMISCGKSADVYIPSAGELRDYCENIMHTICPRYMNDESVVRADGNTRRYGAIEKSALD